MDSPPPAPGEPSRQWSLYAGVYLFLCGMAVTLLLSDLLAVLASVIGLSTDYWLLVVASPTFAIGAVVWWWAVERRGSYTYPVGGLVGLVTALLTGLLWTGQLLLIWGVEMVTLPVPAFLIAFVLGVTAVAGVLAALPFVYARRRVISETADRTGQAT